MEKTQEETTPHSCDVNGCSCPARWKRRIYSPEASTFLCEEHWQELFGRSQMSAGMYDRIQS